MLYIQPITGLLTAPFPASPGSLPQPALASDGVDISNWRKSRTGPLCYDAASVYLIASAAGTLGDANDPVCIVGHRNGAWQIAGYLDGGSAIVFPSGGLRQVRRIGSIGIFDKLAIACAALGGNTYQYQFEPIAEHIST